MILIKDFKNISKTDAAIAGGKGASLGEMTQAGIPVPPGFVILADAFDKFLEETDLNVEIDSILHSVNHKEIHTVEDASEKIHALILGAEIPKDIAKEIQKFFKTLGAKYVAVRSSATAEDSASAAWAGQLESYLNTTKENLLENVKKCWASLFTPRAIFYRFEKDLHKQKISVAVVVQKMVESEKSGIAFSVHPVTQDRNQLIIEAGYGLGEAVVSGQITPDSYVAEKEPRRIIDVNVNTQTRCLIRANRGIGNEWQDISEPKASSQVLSEKEILELSKIILIIENHYGFPVDVEWAWEKGKFYIVQSRPITTLQKSRGVKDITVKYVLGNQDVDASFLTLEMTWSGIRAGEVKKHVGTGMFKSFAEVVGGKTINYFVEAHRIKPFVGACAKSLLSDGILLENLRQGTIKATEQIRQFANKNIGKVNALKNKEIVVLLKEIKGLQAKCATFGSAVAFADIFGEITNSLTGILKKRPNLRYSSNVYTSVLGSPAEQSLTEKAYGEIRDNNESDLILLKKYFWLDQGYIGRGLTAEQLSGIKKRLKEEEEYPSAETLRKELKLNEKEERIFQVSKSLIQIKSLRADSRQFLHVLTNRIIDKIVQELDIKSEYLETLYTEEICEILMGKSLPRNLEERWRHSIIVPNKKSYNVLIGEDAEEFLKGKLVKDEIKDKENIKGQVAQSGKVVGPVKLIFGPQHNGKIKEGDILVSTATSPQLLPAMQRAAAFITDVGGITSHAAIVARELKKPCIVGTKIATQVLKDGDLVEVDAEQGIVKILKKSNDAPSRPITTLSESRKEKESPTFFNGHDWFLTVTRNMSFWHQYLSREGHFHCLKNFGITANLGMLTITEKGTFTSAFMYQPNYGEFAKAVMGSIKTKKEVGKLKMRYEKNADALLKSLENLKGNLTPIALKRFFDDYRIFCAGLMVTATIGRTGGEILAEKLKILGLDEHNISAVIAIITYPVKHTPLFNSQLGLLEIAVRKQENKLSAAEMTEALQKWLIKYGHIPVNFCEEPWTLADAKQQLNSLLIKNCRKELRLVKKSHDNRIAKAKRELKKLNNKEISSIAYAIAEGTYLNEFRKNIFSRVSFELRPVFKMIAQKGGSNNWRDCFYLIPSEMMSIVKGKAVNLLKIVKKREVAGAYIDDKGHSKLMESKDVGHFYRFIKTIRSKGDAVNLGEKIIKGFSANGGKVKGTAKIILSSKDFEKLKPDEILITTMTSVDFVPIMERAAAFVTDEGGITSHASIVAREMNKPCIIGTKIATQVLKDGDLVEVNADNGVVRILNK